MDAKSPISDRFDAFFADRGGRFHYEIYKPLLRDRFKKLIDEYNAIISRSGVSSIYCDYITDQNVNAFAALDNEMSYVAISWGAYWNLGVLYGFLLSHPKVLCGFGDEKKEEVRFNSVPTNWCKPFYGCSAEADAKQITAIFPRDRERMTVAYELFKMTMDFIFYHEMGHVMRGHLEFLREKIGITEVNELNAIGDCGAAIQKALEMDADTFAVPYTTFCQPTIKFETKAEIDMIERAVLLEFFALSVLFLVMDQGRRTVGSYVASSHPHPYLRLTTVLQVSVGRARKNKALGTLLETVWEKITHELAILRHVLQVESATWSAMDDLSTSLKTHRDAVAEFLQFRPQLKKFSKL